MSNIIFDVIRWITIFWLVVAVLVATSIGIAFLLEFVWMLIEVWTEVPYHG